MSGERAAACAHPSPRSPVCLRYHTWNSMLTWTLMLNCREHGRSWHRCLQGSAWPTCRLRQTGTPTYNAHTHLLLAPAQALRCSCLQQGLQLSCAAACILAAHEEEEASDKGMGATRAKMQVHSILHFYGSRTLHHTAWMPAAACRSLCPAGEVPC